MSDRTVTLTLEEGLGVLALVNGFRRRNVPRRRADRRIMKLAKQVSAALMDRNGVALESESEIVTITLGEDHMRFVHSLLSRTLAMNESDQPGLRRAFSTLASARDAFEAVMQ